MPEIFIYNTLTKKIEKFKPIKPGRVGFYNCGPTVYDYDHIGHAWLYFNADILRRVLNYNGYQVKYVLNITDVGHLTSDADTGEDKLEKAAKLQNRSAREIADFFTKIYLTNRQKLNLLPPTKICRVTDYIKPMIKMVDLLLRKGFAYQISDGIYFDTVRFSRYGQLSGNRPKNLKAGARVEINPEKRNPADFALWKFSAPEEKRQMEWSAFGRQGFPGWHLECSVMSIKHLGAHFDFHAGGEDNIFPHHECEIAQSEAATGKTFVNYWFHVRFLKVEGEKMSKSKNNFYTIDDLEKKGFSALDLRYLFLTGHYRSQFNFTWQGLAAAKSAREKLIDWLSGVERQGKVQMVWQKKFRDLINQDLALPQSLALVWNLLKSDLPIQDRKATLLNFDQVLGLNLKSVKPLKIPAAVKKIAQKRQIARQAKDWPAADQLRKEIENLGFIIEDREKGYKLIKK